MSVLSEEHQRQLEQILVDTKLIDGNKLQALKKEASSAKVPFLSFLVQHGHVLARRVHTLLLRGGAALRQ